MLRAPPPPHPPPPTINHSPSPVHPPHHTSPHPTTPACPAAAGGTNTVEREGISIVHPAKFIMIGSGNPAEGELRPQLLDRFGLSGECRVGWGGVGW